MEKTIHRIVFSHKFAVAVAAPPAYFLFKFRSNLLRFLLKIPKYLADEFNHGFLL
jgi:hypothetical protein